MIFNYPGSIFVDEARVKYRELREIYPETSAASQGYRVARKRNSMKSTDKALLFAGLAVFFWSPVATAFKIALRELDVFQLIFYASGVTVVLLFLILLFQRKTGQLLKQTPRGWLWSILMGAFNPLLYYLVLLKAYSLLPAQLAQPLNMIWPIVLALLSVPLLKQKIGG
jgi:drug/metabolite transporter (DMT)-like permease